jgi:hypothetical protein
LKKPAYLPLSEIRAAICQVVSQNLGIQREDVSPAVARLFEFRSTSAGVRDIVERQLERLLETGQLVLNESRLFVAVDAEVG